ncbi:putative r3h domain protein [Botrytis fragariae]|uniref:Putative r3h domain protein n=1 Tax=Botrytis fragariae TaxID=1964551 RepID=A0A8H6B0E5_9HELO|nr:putative r3h domain protein [Botrytis fragariae]KAF5876817.1 putative r3h domain protein [Botrytis fragariae]
MSTIKRYIEQLSKDFFKKENLRGKTWWLSVFYSLVIQTLVRAFMKTINLHLAVRLFIATSGAHDPLARSIPVQGSRLKALAGCDSCKRRKLECTRWKPSCEACQDFQCPCIYGGKSEIDDSEIKNYNVASLSVQEEKWRSYGLNSPGDF